MNWFKLIMASLAMAGPIVQSVETLAGHVKTATGAPMTSAQKAAAGVSLSRTGLAIVGISTGQVPDDQVSAVIQSINDQAVVEMNSQADTALLVPVPVK